MATWFLGKIRYTKEVEPGKFQTITEAYLLDAVSFTDSEARLYDLLGDNAPDFRVTSLAPMKVQEVFHVEGPELKWFKVKIVMTTFDEKTKKEKKSSSLFLVNADSVKQAYDRVEDLLGRVEDYEITDVGLTPILEVVPYEVDNQRLDTLRPMEEAVNAFEREEKDPFAHFEHKETAFEKLPEPPSPEEEGSLLDDPAEEIAAVAETEDDDLREDVLHSDSDPRDADSEDVI